MTGMEFLVVVGMLALALGFALWGLEAYLARQCHRAGVRRGER